MKHYVKATQINYHKAQRTLLATPDSMIHIRITVNYANTNSTIYIINQRVSKEITGKPYCSAHFHPAILFHRKQYLCGRG